MRQDTKTLTQITWPNGRTCFVDKRGRYFHWRTENGNEATSSHMGNLKANVTQRGGTLKRVPNPHYDPTRRDASFYFDFRRGFVDRRTGRTIE